MPGAATRRQGVVRIQDHSISRPSGPLQSFVIGFYVSLVSGVAADPDSPVSRGKAGGNPLRVIARGIIDDENFQVHTSLAQHAFDANG